MIVYKASWKKEMLSAAKLDHTLNSLSSVVWTHCNLFPNEHHDAIVGFYFQAVMRQSSFQTHHYTSSSKSTTIVCIETKWLTCPSVWKKCKCALLSPITPACLGIMFIKELICYNALRTNLGSFRTPLCSAPVFNAQPTIQIKLGFI